MKQHNVSWSERLISILCVLALVFNMMPAMVFAENKAPRTPKGGVTVTVKDGAEAVPDAHIEYFAADGASAGNSTTDASGKAMIPENIEVVRIEVSCAGYLPEKQVYPYAGESAVEASLSKNLDIASITDPVAERTLYLNIDDQKSVTLLPEVLPAGHTEKVVWSVNDNGIVNVENGVVTAVSVGDTTVTASAEKHPNINQVYNIHVKKGVDYIRLSEENIGLQIGENKVLTVEVFPPDAADKTVVWSTDKQSVATVDNGNVTAVGNGVAHITAECGGRKAVCTVQVATAVAGVTIIDKPNGDLAYGDTHQLNVQVTPAGANEKAVWSVKRGDAVQIDSESGMVTAVKPGKATIKVQVGAASDEFKIKVVPRKVKVKGIVLKDKEYDGTTTVDGALQSTVTFENKLEADTLNLSGVVYGNTADANASETIHKVLVDLNRARLDNDNYVLDSSANGVFAEVKIVKKPLSVMELKNKENQIPTYTAQKSYTDLILTLGGIAEADKHLNGQIAGVTASSENKPVVLNEGADVLLTYGEQDLTAYKNYVLPTNAKLFIQPMELQAVVEGTTKEYDGTKKAKGQFPAELKGVLTGDTVTPVVTDSAYRSSRVSNSVPISAKVNLAGEDAQNYSLPKEKIVFTDGAIVKSSNGVLLVVRATPSVADPDTQLTINIEAKGNDTPLNGTAVVTYKTKTDTATRNVDVKNGQASFEISAVPGEQKVEVSFTVAESEEGYEGTHKAETVYNKGYKVQELVGTPITEVEYGAPAKLGIKAVEQGTDKETGAEIAYESNNSEALTIDEQGMLHVRDVKAAAGEKHQVTITAYAKAKKGYNASYKQTYTVSLLTKEVTPSMTCVDKEYDGTDKAKVVSALEGVAPEDKDVVLSTNGVDGEIEAFFSGKDASEEEYTVTAKNLVLAGKTAAGVDAANNYTLKIKELSVQAKIRPKNISNEELALALDAEGVMYYTGDAREPAATVNVDLDGDTVKETTLSADVDYTTEYENQKDLGEASATVVGKGNYTGSIRRTYTIVYKPADPNAELVFVDGSHGDKPAARRAYPKDAANKEYWYNSGITVTAAEGYTFDDVKPVGGKELQSSKTYGDEGDAYDIFKGKTFYVRENRTGIISQIKIKDILSVDKTAPVLTEMRLSRDGAAYAEGNYYNQGFTVTFVLDEENYGNMGENSSFAVAAGTEAVSQTGEVQAKVNQNTEDKTQITVNVEPGDALITSETHIPYLEVTDPAGNKLVTSLATVTCTNGKAVDNTKRILDTKVPEVVISYPTLEDYHYYGTTAYYNQELIASYVFTDENGIDLNKVHKVVDVSEGSDFASVDQAAEAEKDTIVIKAQQENNGHYQFSAYGTDKAGNALTVKEMQTTAGNPPAVVTPNMASKKTSAYHKVLDTVSPSVEIKIDAGDSLRKELQTEYNNRYYFNDDFTMTVSISDKNYDTNKVVVRTGQKLGTEIELSGEPVEAEKVLNGTLTENGCVYTVTSSGEGVYILDGKGVDRAGNKIVLSGGNQANSVESIVPDQIEASGEAADRFITYVIAEDKTQPMVKLHMQDDNNNENGFNLETGNFFEAMLSKDGYQIQTNWPYRSSKTADFGFETMDQSPVTVLYQVESTAPNSSFKYELNGASGIVGKDGTAPKGAYQNALANTRPVIENEQVLQIADFTAEDLAGNQVSVNKTQNDNKIYLDVQTPTDDNLQPVVRLSVPKPVASNTMSQRPISGAALYNGPVEIKADIMDPYTQGSTDKPAIGSGLKRVYYKVTVNGESSDLLAGSVALVTKTGRTAQADPNQPGVYYVDYGTTGQSGQVEGNEALTAADQLTLTFDPTVSDGVFNFNSIELQVWGIDNANNGIAQQNKAEYTFGIDITAPEISVSYDNNDAENEFYFKADRTATVTVTERNFDPGKIHISTESGAISGWSYSQGDAPNGDRDQWTCTITYAVDGMYTLNISGTDQLGTNASTIVYNGTAPQKFVIDKTAPTVTVSFDNNDVRNGKYYNRSRTATVNVNEVNFAGKNDIQVNAAAGGSAPAVAFNGTIAVLPFTVDGNYDLRGTVTDLAGNVSQEFLVEQFVIDQTAPELHIGGVEEGAAYAGEVLPSVEFSDQNYDSNQVLLKRTVLNEKNADVTELLKAQGGVTVGAEGYSSGSIRYEDLEHVQQNDGIYTITASVADLAGNTAEASINYLVNRFGTVYVYSDALNSMIGQYKQQAEKDLYIMAYNVTPLVADSTLLQITCDGAMLQNQHSKVQPANEARIGESGWYEYRYDIDNEDLLADGRYEITISDLDEAGNTKTNADNPIWFYMDTTKPALDSVIGLEKNIVDGENQNVRFVISDAIALGSVRIYVDGKEVHACEKFAGTQYESSFDVGSGLRQKVQFVIQDKAGNVLDTNEESFVPSYQFNKELTVSSNLFVRLYANTPLFWTLIGAIIVIFGGMITFFVVTKKKKKEAAED